MKRKESYLGTLYNYYRIIYSGNLRHLKDSNWEMYKKIDNLHLWLIINI